MNFGLPFSRLDTYKEFLLVEDIKSYPGKPPFVPVYKKIDHQFAQHVRENRGVKIKPETLVVEILR